MEETSNHKAVSSLGGLERDFSFPLLSDMANINPSPLSIKSELKTLTVQTGLLSIDTASVPHLIDSPILSTDVIAKTESHDLISGSKFKCSECSKSFDTDKALFGHMRIHNGSKRPSIPKPKPKPTARPVPYPSIYPPFTVTWSVTKKRGWKPVIDRNSPEAVAAYILMDLPNSSWTRKPQEETTRTPLSELARVACNTSLPSHQTLERPTSSHQKEKSTVAIEALTKRKRGEMTEGAKKKAKDGLHVCEICGEGYPMGQQLGGHKRKHYKPQDQ